MLHQPISLWVVHTGQKRPVQDLFQDPILGDELVNQLAFRTGYTLELHTLNVWPIESGYYSVQCFLVPHVIGHWVKVRYLENHFPTAFWDQQLGDFFSCLHECHNSLDTLCP